MASAAWLRAIELNPESIVLAKIHYGDGDAFIGVGSKGMNYDGHAYKGLININPINVRNGAEISPVAAKIQTASASITINNGEDEAGERFSDLLDDTSLGTGSNYGFEGRLIDIRLITPSVTDWDDCLILAQGEMGEPKDNGDVVVIPFSSELDMIDRKIEDLVTDADEINGVLLPAGSKGQHKPKLWGAHRYPKNIYSEGGRSLASSLWEADPAEPSIKLIPMGENKYLVSGEELDTASFDTGDSIWAKSTQLGRWVELVDWTVVSHDSNGLIIERDGDTWFDYRFPTGINGLDPAEWTDPELGVNKTISDGATASISSGDPNGTTKTMKIDFPNNDLLLADINDIKFICNYVKVDLGAVYRLYAWSNTHTFTSAGAENLFHRSAGTPTINATNLELVDLVFNKFAASATAGDMGVRASYMQVEYEDTALEDLYWGGSGRNNKIFVRGRSTSEGYGTTHADDDNNGALNTNPATQAEDFLRTDLNLELAVNGDMGSSTGWTLGAGWSIGSDILTAAAASSDAVNDDTLRKGRKTRATIEVLTSSGGPAVLKLGSSGDSLSLALGQQTLEGLVAGSEDLIISGSAATGTLDHLSVADAINNGSFNEASVPVSAMSLSPKITSTILGRNHLAQIALQSRSIIWMHEGQFNQKVIEDTYSSADLKLDYKSLQDNDFIRTDKKDIWTSVEVLFGLDANGTFTKTTGVASDADAQARYGRDVNNNLLRFKASYIKDPATALLLQSYLLAQWKQQHNIHTFSLGLAGMQLNVGNTYQLYNARTVRGNDIELEYTLLGQTIYPFWLIYNIVQNQFGSKYEAIQLHRLDGS